LAGRVGFGIVATKRSSSRYHSPLRARQAAATREAIVAAAIALFAERGWAATTLPMVASKAGIAVDTIYSTFGTKSDLFMAAIDVAIMGDDDSPAMIDRPEFALISKGRRTERLRTAVHFTMAVYERSVPMLKALREAAASDETARARLAQYDEDRRNVVAAGLELIVGAPASEQVIDALWALVSPEVFTHLTEGRGWSVARTEAWLVEMSNATIAGAARH
jgi:AcrR family transcriptional regulator